MFSAEALLRPNYKWGQWGRWWEGCGLDMFPALAMWQALLKPDKKWGVAVGRICFLPLLFLDLIISGVRVG